MMESVLSKMNAYYRAMDANASRVLINEQMQRNHMAIKERILSEFYAFCLVEPNAALQKSRLHTLVAEHFEPILFDGYPFAFEMGLRHSKSWGLGPPNPVFAFVEQKTSEAERRHPLYKILTDRFMGLFLNQGKLGICHIPAAYDRDHQTLGTTKLFSCGVDGLLAEVRAAKPRFPDTSEENAYLRAVEESLLAVLRIAERFAEKAGELLKTCADPEGIATLTRIRDALSRIPAKAPQSFYEGLFTLLFMREVTATLECIGISNLGHVDRLLGDLYQKDVKEGRLTEKEAKELLFYFMVYTDIKFDLRGNDWPETSTCIQLGGCDEDGVPIYNDVTRLFIEVHTEHGLINPKLNCRYATDCPDEYLHLIGKALLAGHNNFVLISDELTVKGLMRCGVAERAARRYVSGGCQETMLEGYGHTEGAALYVSLPRILDLFLRPDEDDVFFPSLDAAESFEEFYRKFMDTLYLFFSVMTDQRNIRQGFQKDATVCPLFSATQEGCIENGRDCSAGGAVYNFSTVALVGLANVADSLYAIRTLVYERTRISLSEFNRALEANWESYGELHSEVLALPKYGHGSEDVDRLADRFLSDVTRIVKSFKNERGGSYIASTFVYYHFERLSKRLRATPDGRRSGERMAMGCSPSELQRGNGITEPVETMNHVDFSVCGGASVLDVSLPHASGLTTDILTAFVRTAFLLGCPTLQPNVLSREELLDAKCHPERHKNLIVRIAGLSAYFVTLSPSVQDEIIDRTQYSI